MISRIDIEDMTDAQDEALLPCPFCGSECVQPQGWTGTNMKGERTSGPACDRCGATTETAADWNRRADLARPSQAGDESVARLRDVACGATTMIAHALDDGQIDEEVVGNFEALLTELNEAIAALAAMDTPKGGGDE